MRVAAGTRTSYARGRTNAYEPRAWPHERARSTRPLAATWHAARNLLGGWTSGGLGEVHDLLGDGVHGDGARHGDGRAVLAAGRLVAALTGVVLFLHQVVARAERHQVRVVGGRWDRHRAGAPHVRVTQLVREALQLIRAEVVVVPQHVIM